MLLRDVSYMVVIFVGGVVCMIGSVRMRSVIDCYNYPVLARSEKGVHAVCCLLRLGYAICGGSTEELYNDWDNVIKKVEFQTDYNAYFVNKDISYEDSTKILEMMSKSGFVLTENGDDIITYFLRMIPYTVSELLLDKVLAGVRIQVLDPRLRMFVGSGDYEGKTFRSRVAEFIEMYHQYKKFDMDVYEKYSDVIDYFILGVYRCSDWFATLPRTGDVIKTSFHFGLRYHEGFFKLVGYFEYD